MLFCNPLQSCTDKAASEDEDGEDCNLVSRFPEFKNHFILPFHFSSTTEKLSSSQPTDSPYRRTLSRVCSNAWFALLQLLNRTLQRGLKRGGLAETLNMIRLALLQHRRNRH